MCKLIMDMFLATLYQNYVKNEQQQKHTVGTIRKFNRKL